MGFSFRTWEYRKNLRQWLFLYPADALWQGARWTRTSRMIRSRNGCGTSVRRTFRTVPSEGSLYGRGCHDQFHRIHKDFFKRFAYICHWFEGLKALGLVLHKYWFSSHNQKGWITSNLLIINELYNAFLMYFPAFYRTPKHRIPSAWRFVFDNISMNFIGFEQGLSCPIVKFLNFRLKFTEVLYPPNGQFIEKKNLYLHDLKSGGRQGIQRNIKMTQTETQNNT